jgi:hypothetical protein
MAFPTIANSATHTFAAGLNHNVPGLSPTAGQLILWAVGIEDGQRTITTPGGLTLLAEDDPLANTTGASGRFSTYAKIATGSEGTTNVNFVTDGSRVGVAHQYIIDDWYGDIATGIAVSSSVIPQTTNPGSVTAPWGSADNKFIAIVASFDDPTNFTVAPTNYSNLLNVVTGSVGVGAGMGSATRDLASASDDPDAFTQDPTGGFEFAITLVIRPADVVAGGSLNALLLGVG